MKYKVLLIVSLCFAFQAKAQLEVGTKMGSFNIGLSKTSIKTTVETIDETSKSKTSESGIFTEIKGGYAIKSFIVVGGNLLFERAKYDFGNEQKISLNTFGFGAFSRFYLPVQFRVVPWAEVGINNYFMRAKGVSYDDLELLDESYKDYLFSPGIQIGLSLFNKDRNTALELSIEKFRRPHIEYDNSGTTFKLGYQIYF